MSTVCSIIVVTLNEAKHIVRLKSAIDSLERPADVEIETILIDGGSDDGTAEAARHAGFTKVVELAGASIPACRNRGLAEASGDLLAFLDGDCEPAPDWLKRALPFLPPGEPVIIGWPVEPPGPPTWVQHAWHIHWQYKNRARLRAPKDGIIRSEAFRLITTRNMLLTRGAANQLGGFDESLPTGEDTDFVFRACGRHMTVLGVPFLRVIHHGEPATLGAFFRQQIWHANRSSYGKILGATGSRAGRNVILFSIAYAAALALFLLAVPLTLVIGCPCALAFTLPLAAILLGPAALIAARARDFSLVLPLCALYAAYGLARTLDLVGFFRTKRSWKRNPPTSRTNGHT